MAADEEVDQALSTSPLSFDLLQPSTLNSEKWMLGPMVGRSAAMQHLFARMRYTAPHFRLASVEGEPGSGKLLTARTLHPIGPAAAGPFAPWLASRFLEAPDLHWREAGGGLLYLSRVDELPPDQQRGLRDFLERAAHDRIRSRPDSGPLQVVAGSAQPLRRLAAAGSFRSDLAGHLTAIRFVLPPLRERHDDIPLLAGLFLGRWTVEHHKPLRGFAAGTLSRLSDWSWPGNVLELESVIAAAALECPGQWIRPIDLPRLDWPIAAASAVSSDLSAEDSNLDRAILRHIVRVLARANGNKVRAARMLGISRSTLYRLLDTARAPSLWLPA
jgi:DNA-binding NtrC family response regulator